MIKNEQQSWFRYLMFFQCLMATVAVSGFFVFQGQMAGISAVLGAIIGIVPGLFFGVLLTRIPLGAKPRTLLKSLYGAEIFKLFIFLILFTLVVQWDKLEGLPFVTVFIISQIASLLLPFLRKGS